MRPIAGNYLLQTSTVLLLLVAVGTAVADDAIFDAIRTDTQRVDL